MLFKIALAIDDGECLFIYNKRIGVTLIFRLSTLTWIARITWVIMVENS